MTTIDTAAPIALVTGGGRGLGRSTALQLARKGVDVVLTYHSDEAAADAVAAEIETLGRKAAILQLDTGVTAEFDAFAASLRRTLGDVFGAEQISFLVNNAGIGINAPIAEMTEAQFDTLVNIHFKGVFFLTQKLLPLIADGGRIVNLSSGLARFSMPGYAAYGAAKGAVEVLSRYMAQELGPRGIAVNAVAPGAIETDFAGGFIRDTPAANAHVASLTAMGRAGIPDDIGGMIASLLVGDNGWVTGQRIEVSGGMNL